MSAPRREDRNPDEIRRDIESTRSEMHETVEALERKLSPGQLIDEVWGRVRGSGGAKGAASGIGDVIRDHPVPLGLMGLGMAWLAVESATGSGDDDVGPGTYGRAEGRVGPYRGDAVDGELETDDEGLMDRAKSAASSVSDKAGDAKDSLKARASSAGHEASHKAKQGARKAKSGFWSALEEQPLGMAAVAFGLGVAGGLSVPTTEVEDRVMGDAADSVKREAKETAKDAASSAKAVAKDAARAARDEADRQDVVGDMKQSVERIAAEARETAEQRARQEDLDADGLKDRAEEAGENVRRRME